MMQQEPLKKRFSMSEFGPVHGATKEIRVNHVKHRLHPLVAFPHRHDFYQLQLISKGRGWHEIDFQRFPVHALDVFFVRPGQVHGWRLGHNTQGYIIEFAQSIADREAALFPHWNETSLATHLSLGKASPKVSAAILGLVRLMQEEYNNQAPDFEIVLEHYLIPILVELQRLSPKGPAARPRSDELVERFQKLVASHYKQERSVAFYARKLKTTPSALSMRVLRGLGKSPSRMIQDRSLLEAKRLLAYSSLNVSEVGFEAGFADPSHFSRFFRKAAGMNPAEFRATAKKTSVF